MAGEIVSNGMSNNAIAHSVNRAASFLLNRPVHRCKFTLSIPVPALSFNSQSLDLNGSQWDSMPVWFNVAFGSLLWETTDYIPQVAWSVIGTINGAPAWPFVYDDYSPAHKWVAFLSLFPHIGTAPFQWVLTADIFPNPSTQDKYPAYSDFVTAHAAWTAPWREAFQNTAATSVTGSILFTPMPVSAAADFYASAVPIVDLRIPAADRGDHIYVPSNAFTAQVVIAEQ